MENEDKRQKILLIIFFIIASFAIYFFYTNFFIKQDKSLNNFKRVDIKKNKKEKIDFTESVRFEKLKKYGKYPEKVLESEKGRINPFEPIN